MHLRMIGLAMSVLAVVSCSSLPVRPAANDAGLERRVALFYERWERRDFEGVWALRSRALRQLKSRADYIEQLRERLAEIDVKFVLISDAVVWRDEKTSLPNGAAVALLVIRTKGGASRYVPHTTQWIWDERFVPRSGGFDVVSDWYLSKEEPWQ